ncbi:MAG TPA: 50S ribosomal protein L13 [Candidatus Solibacter sp.]|jgi:large subunit ribosomal protein L13|nr:50S ribosomal protein L13 [Candidatus Solibacter sp.]
MKTYTPKASELKPNWYLVDADGQTLGRLASNIAKVLKGKHKAAYTPHLNTGDFIVVVNAERIHVTGNKREAKTYERYSGYPGGLRSRTLEEQLARRPEEPLREAVRGMLQHNTLGGEMLKRLKVYAGAEHKQQAQQPRPIKFNAKGEIEVIGN